MPLRKRHKANSEVPRFQPADCRFCQEWRFVIRQGELNLHIFSGAERNKRTHGHAPFADVLQSAAIGAGTLLILGLWTPIAGTLVILVEVCFAFLGSTQVRSYILLGALGASLAVLGPGIRSIDALRYGRKRFDIRDP